MLVRLPSCVLRSLDAFRECFGFGFAQCRRHTWVDRRFGLPSFGCSHSQRFSTSRRRVTKLGHLLGELEDLVEFLCQRLSSLSLAMPSIQPADKIECSRNEVLQSAFI